MKGGIDHLWRISVMVSTLEFESRNIGSNPVSAACPNCLAARLGQNKMFRFHFVSPPKYIGCLLV